MIRHYTSSDEAAVLTLWNTAGTAMGYAPMTPAGFCAKITEHPDFAPDCAFVLELDGAVCGFVTGCTGGSAPQGDRKGYLTCLILSPEADTEENTALLLRAMEAAFRAKGREKIALSFFNPMRLSWVLPKTPGHQHNNMPGAALDWPLYARMRALGYDETSREQAMYLDLSAFVYPKNMRDREAAIAQEGYTVAQYDGSRHRGLLPMLESLGNPLWVSEITKAAQGQRLLVGLYRDQVAGFAGPVYPEETGRGYFSGIGVGPSFAHHGLGTLLFYRLCQAEKEAGAQYMSLFTGVANPARLIYEGAGFQTKRVFAVLDKDLGVAFGTEAIPAEMG